MLAPNLPGTQPPQFLKLCRIEIALGYLHQMTHSSAESTLVDAVSTLFTVADARLRRLARLAKLPFDTPLDKDQIVISECEARNW